jgi:hypothetical protein
MNGLAKYYVDHLADTLHTHYLEHGIGKDFVIAASRRLA